jgi:hypothetical protein
VKAQKSLTASFGAVLCLGLCACGSSSGSSQSASMPPPTTPAPSPTTSYSVNDLARLVGSTTEVSDPVSVDDGATMVTPVDDETSDATSLY